MPFISRSDSTLPIHPSISPSGEIVQNVPSGFNIPLGNPSGLLIQTATTLPTQPSRQVQVLPTVALREEERGRGAISSASSSLANSPLAAKLQNEKEGFLAKIYKGIFCIDVAICLIGVAIICIPGVNVAAVSAVVAVTAVTALSMVLYNAMYKVESAINIATESAVVLRPAGDAVIGAFNNAAGIVEDASVVARAITSSTASVAHNNARVVCQYPTASLVGFAVGACFLAYIGNDPLNGNAINFIASSAVVLASTSIGANIAEKFS